MRTHVPASVRTATVADAAALACLEMGHPSPPAEREWRARLAQPVGTAGGATGDIQGGAADKTVGVLVGEDSERQSGEVVAYLRLGMPAVPRYHHPPSMEILGLYVLANYRRRGFGTALVAEAARRAQAAGAQRLLARCIASNAPARCFYDALAAQVVDQGMFVDGGLVIEEVLYGWEDLLGLVAAASARQR